MIIIAVYIDVLRRRDEPYEFNDDLHRARDPYELADASRALVDAVGGLRFAGNQAGVVEILHDPAEIAGHADARRHRSRACGAAIRWLYGVYPCCARLFP